MRISDWSSDVCSSDLIEEAKRRGEIGHAEPSAQRRHRFGRHVAFARAQLLPQGATLAVVGKAEQIVLRPAEQRRDEQAGEVGVVDRKSVGWGRRVAGRVEVGGVRYINKKKTTK